VQEITEEFIMSDVFSSEKRSEIMSKIKGKDTKIEVQVRKWLFANGFRFRKNDKRYPGTPDIVLPKYRTIIFVNGCFWHGHMNCKLYVRPKSNTEFWEKKIKRNRERDKRNIDELRNMGWNVVIIWECELKSNIEEILRTVVCQMHTQMK